MRPLSPFVMSIIVATISSCLYELEISPRFPFCEPKCDTKCQETTDRHVFRDKSENQTAKSSTSHELRSVDDFQRAARDFLHCAVTPHQLSCSRVDSKFSAPILTRGLDDMFCGSLLRTKIPLSLFDEDKLVHSCFPELNSLQLEAVSLLREKGGFIGNIYKATKYSWQNTSFIITMNCWLLATITYS